jgi:hypothetical protein
MNINHQERINTKIYNICKNNFGLEKYLTIVNNVELRRSFTKLRTSSHRLQIDIKVFPDTTECAHNVLQMLLKINYIFYLNAQNTMKTENQCCLKLQLYVVTLEI